MRSGIKKIPKHYLEEFLKNQTAIIKSQTQLAAVLFSIVFFAGSFFNLLVLNKHLEKPLIAAWILSLFISIAALPLSRAVKSFYGAKLNAVLIITLCLSVLGQYYIGMGDPPFNVGMTYIFAFLGFALMFPWSPSEIIGIFILHAGAYTVFLLNTDKYVYRKMVFPLGTPDYLQGFVILFLSFLFCHIVTERERKREVENYLLLKEIEEKNLQMKNELELATKIHSRLIPQSTSTPLADIAVTYLPVYYMGGDYAKFHFIGDKKLIFIICDVTGHGVSAALLVNVFNSEFERHAREGKYPGALLKEMNQFISDNFAKTNMYLTAFCGLLDYGSSPSRFIYSNYGHPPQYVYSANDSRIEKISAQTSFLGLPAADENIYQNEIPFTRGDEILLFTDGVIEAKDIKGEDYGDNKLENFLRKNSRLEAGLFNQKLLNELRSFTGNNLKDDIFILNIKTK